jgi:hypothetical protein
MGLAASLNHVSGLGPIYVITVFLYEKIVSKIYYQIEYIFDLPFLNLYFWVVHVTSSSTRRSVDRVTYNFIQSAEQISFYKYWTYFY